MTPCGKFWLTYLLALALALVATAANAASCTIHDVVAGDWRGSGLQVFTAENPDGTYSTVLGTLTCRLQFRLRGGLMDAVSADVHRSRCTARDASLDAAGQPTQNDDVTLAEGGVISERSRAGCRFRLPVLDLLWADLGPVRYYVDDIYMARHGGRPVALTITGRWGFGSAPNAAFGAWTLHLVNVR